MIRHRTDSSLGLVRLWDSKRAILSSPITLWTYHTDFVCIAPMFSLYQTLEL